MPKKLQNKINYHVFIWLIVLALTYQSKIMFSLIETILEEFSTIKHVFLQKEFLRSLLFWEVALLEVLMYQLCPMK